MTVEFDATKDDYKGVHAKLRTTRSPAQAYPQQRFTYVMQIGSVFVEIEEKTAVQLSEDLINCVSDANDPNSAMRKRWAERFQDNGDGTVTFRG